MEKRLPALGLSAFPVLGKFFSRITLGALLFGLLLGYQPTFGFPPIKQVKVYAQAEQVQSVASASLPFAFQLPHAGYLSTPYSNQHLAVDIATGLGMPIRPIAPGVVVKAGYNLWGLGLMVEVDNGYGYKSTYAHMGKIYVKKGQQVSASDILGEVGLTGNTTGPHTHLELRKDGKIMNPQTVLPTIRAMPVAEDFKPVGAKK